jgi:hypothetical protein
MRCSSRVPREALCLYHPHSCGVYAEKRDRRDPPPPAAVSAVSSAQVREITIAGSGTARDVRLGMPRYVRPRATYAVCRRTELRRFLLRPDFDMKRLFRWVLAGVFPILITLHGFPLAAA